MIGKTVRSLSPFPVGATLYLVAALGLFALAAGFASVHPALVGTAFLVLAFCLFLIPRPRVVLTFTRDGIDVEQPDQFIPYDTIHTLRPFGRSQDFHSKGRDHFALNVVHQNGVLFLPASLNVSSEDVLQFLDARLPDRGGDWLPKTLARHAEEQSDLFGEDRVSAYGPRDHLGYRSAYPWGRIYFAFVLACTVLLVTGCVFLTDLGRTSQDIGAGYIGAAFLVWLLGSLIWFVARSAQGNGSIRAIRNWQRSGLVISPAGIALVQGDLKGELAWEEIRDVKLARGQAAGIVLRVEGANILIADIYCVPLSRLLEKIHDNWRDDRDD